MGRVITWIAAGVAAIATMLFVGALSASAAQLNATVQDDGTAYIYEGAGVDKVLIGTDGTNTGVTFNSGILGGSPMDAAAPCATAAFGATCPAIKPVVANLGDMDDLAELGSTAPPTTIHAGAGNDQLYANAGRALVAFGDGGDDELYGSTAADTFDGGAGDDVLHGGSDGADDLHGGPGLDTVMYPGVNPTNVSLDDVANDGPKGIANVHSDVELVSTGPGDDRLTGDDGPNGLSGGDGRDTIDGRGGRDDLRGGPGDDTILARDGFRDTIDCGAGNDVAKIDPADVAVNCETIEYADDDHDGVTAERDCDDHDPSSFPGAREAPGDGIDQDCDGFDAPAIVEYVTTDPGASRVRAGFDSSWVVHARYTKVARLVAEDVPAGGQVEVRCSGKGCGFKHKVVAARRGKASLTKLFRHRELKPRTAIELRVTAAGMVGRIVSFTVRAGKLPAKTTLCLEPGGSTPLRCA